MTDPRPEVEHRLIKVFVGSEPPAIGFLEYERPEDVLTRVREAMRRTLEGE